MLLRTMSNFALAIRSRGEEDLAEVLGFLMGSKIDQARRLQATRWGEAEDEKEGGGNWLVIYTGREVISKTYPFPASLDSAELWPVVRKWLEEQEKTAEGPGMVDGGWDAGFEVIAPPSCTDSPWALFAVRHIWAIFHK